MKPAPTATEARLQRNKELYKAGSSINHAERRKAKLAEKSKEKKGQAVSKRRRLVEEDSAFVLAPAAVYEVVKASAAVTVTSARLEALKTLRRFTSTADEEGMQVAIDAGIVPVLTFYVSSRLGTPAAPAGAAAGAAAHEYVSDEERLEAVWCCTNLAAGSHEHTMAVLRSTSVALIALLMSPNALLADHAAWALGNCAGDGQEARDTLIAQGVAHPMVGLLACRSKPLALTAAWALTNLLKGPLVRAQPFTDAGIIPAAVRWVGLIDSLVPGAAPASETAGGLRAAGATGSAEAAADADGAAAARQRTAELIAECVWVLAYLTDKDDAVCHAIAAAGGLSLLTRVLLHGSLRSVSPCLRVLGNVLSCADAYVDAAVDPATCPGLLDALAIIAAPATGPGGGGAAGGSGASSPRSPGSPTPAGFGCSSGSAAFASPSIQYDADHTSSLPLYGSGAAAAAVPAGLSSGSGMDSDGDAGGLHGRAGAGSSAGVGGGGSCSSPCGRFDAAAVHADIDAMGAGSEGASLATLPPGARFAGGYVREALWVLSNIAGGQPRHAIALLSFSLPAHVAGVCASMLAAAGCTAEQAALGFLPLFVCHAAGLWNVRRSATWCLFNLAQQRFCAVPSEGPAGGTPLPGSYPLLGAILSYPPVLPLFMGHLSAPDLELVRTGLAFTDLVLYNWRRPARVKTESPFAPQPAPPALEAAGASSSSTMGAAGSTDATACSHAPAPTPLPASVLALGPDTVAGHRSHLGHAPHSLSGAALVEEAGGIAQLEYVRETHGGYGGEDGGVESGDSATGDDGSLRASTAATTAVARRQVARWASHLLDTFYGEDADEDDGDEVPGGFGLSLPPAAAGTSALWASGAPATTAAGHFAFGAPAVGVAPAASVAAPPVRGRMATLPAWMTAQQQQQSTSLGSMAL